MKLYPRKIMCLFMTFAMLFSIGSLSAGAEIISDENCGYDIAECANEVKESFKKQEIANETSPDDEFLANNYASVITYNLITEHIYAHDDELREHFAGAYVNGDGCLVVLLSCDSDACEKYISSQFDNDDIIFSEGKGSYYEGQRELETVNKRIALLQNDIINDTAESEEAEKLMALRPRTSYNNDSNSVTVIFSMPPEIEQMLKKNRTGDMAELLSIQPKMTSSEKAALSEYSDAVEMFKNQISSSDTISFSASSEEIQLIDYTEKISVRDAEFWYITLLIIAAVISAGVLLRKTRKK